MHGESGPHASGPAAEHAGRSCAGGGKGDPVRDDLVLAHLDLAEALATRFARGREVSDLRQVAYLGLVKAARRFDPERGGSFPAFAAPTIRGEMKRYLRDHCWVVRPPREVQDLRTRILRTAPALAQTLGRSPTAKDLAQELGVSGAEIRAALAASASMSPDSLDVPDPDGTRSSLVRWLGVSDSEPERLDELLALDQALRRLSATDRELLYHRYVGEETQTALGRRFGMTQMQISRRLARILVQLQRSLLDPEQGPSASQSIQRPIR